MILDELLSANENAIQSFKTSLKQFYSGNTTPMLLDNIRVEYYGEIVPIEMCSVISVRSHDLLIVRPFESKMLGQIAHAIDKANIGLRPVGDSELIKVYMPKRTKEADRTIFKLIKQRAEQAKIVIRSNRKTAREDAKSLSKDPVTKLSLDKDSFTKLNIQIQTQTDEAIGQIDSILQDKKVQMRLENE